MQSSGRSRIYRGSFTYSSNRISDIETVAFSGGQFLPEKSDSSYIMTPSFVLTDRLGSPRVVMNSAGTPVTYNSYYPFGLTHYDYLYSAQMVKANRFMFNGKEKQAFSTNMDFKLLDYGARMYDPNIGRWTTQDPAGQFTNPYIFCGNNPVCFIDADGQWVMFIPMIIGAIAGGYTGYLIGKAAGASGWDMAGYILGGAGIGALASGAAVGIAATGGGAMLAGMGAGFLGGAGFNLLSGGSFIDAMKAGAIGGFVGLLSGGIGAAIGGRLGAIAAGMVGSGTYAALSGASPEHIAKAAFLGGITSYGVYELTSYISYKYILSNAENQSNGMYALKMTYREYMAMQADFQRSRFWHKEYGMGPDVSGNLNKTSSEERKSYSAPMDVTSAGEHKTKYVSHTHWVSKEGKTIYLDDYGNKMPHLEMYRNEATRMHGAMDIFPVHSLVLGVNTTTFRIANTTTNILLNFPRFEYFPWFIF